MLSHHWAEPLILLVFGATIMGVVAAAVHII